MFGDIVDPTDQAWEQAGQIGRCDDPSSTAVIAAMVIIPLMAADVLPTPPSMMAFVAAPPPPPPPPRRHHRPSRPPKPVEVNPNAAPVECPKEIKPEPVDTNFDRNVRRRGWHPGRRRGRCRRRSAGGAAPPPPPPTQPVRVGGQIKQPTKIKHVRRVSTHRAVSPRAGRRDHRGGDRSERQGAGCKVLRSIPLLDQAALDAVRQWEFTPTLLNNVPVPVIMTVTVQFTLS